MGLIDNVNVNVGGNGNIIDTLSTYVTKILKPNIVDGKNILTQAMISSKNTKYVIKYDYELEEDIIIPEGCILEFDGGSLSGNVTITGSNTEINANLFQIFTVDITLAGTWNVAEAYPEWFGAKGDGMTDDTLSFKKCIESFNGSTINLVFGKTLLLDTFTISSSLNINGNGGCLSFKDNASMFIDYRTQNMQNVNSIEETTLGEYAVVKIQIGDIGGFSIGDIVKLISDDIIGNTTYPSTQYFTVVKIEENYIYCTGNLQFSFTTNIRLALLQNKRCTINNVVLKGERTQFSDFGLITIRGGVFHNIDNVVTKGVSSHGILFIGCYGYSARCKTSYQRYNNDDKLIGMAIVDMASSNFVVEIQSEYSQQFSTVYTNDGSVDCIGISQYGLIKGSVVGDSVDNHSRAYRLTYDAITISHNTDVGIGDRGVECKYLNIISYANNYGVYRYTDTNNKGGTTISIANSQFLNCKRGILVETTTNQDTAILDSCTICATENAISTQNNHVILRNCYIEGDIFIGVDGILEIYNCVVRNCKFHNYGGISIMKNSDIEFRDYSYFIDDTFENCIISCHFHPSFGLFMTQADQTNVKVQKCTFNIEQLILFKVKHINCNIAIQDTLINILPSSVSKYTFILISIAENKNAIANLANINIYNNEVRGLSCNVSEGNITGSIDNVVFKNGVSRCILNNDAIAATLSLINNEYTDASGSTRPVHKVPVGYTFFDTSLSPARPIYWNGTAWVDATGQTV